MFEKLPNSLPEFKHEMLVTTLEAIKNNRFEDNYDSNRTLIDKVDSSKLFSADKRAMFFSWFFENHENIFEAYSQLDDDYSKRLFLHLVSYRMGGHLSVKLPVRFRGKEAEFEEYKRIEAGSESTKSTVGALGNLKHYDFSYQGNTYRVDSYGLEYYLFRKQYFYSNEHVRVVPEVGDAIIDGGACTGDTASVFSNAVGPTGIVYAFDPVQEHVDLLEFNIKQFPYKNVVIMPFGISSKNTYAKPVSTKEMSPGFRVGKSRVPLRSIDHLVSTGEIKRVDYIKLDVEGSELAALKGATESLRKLKPKLAVSLYHNPNDLFELILYIRDQFPFYDLYLDHYTIHYDETVLYCLPKKTFPLLDQINRYFKN